MLARLPGTKGVNAGFDTLVKDLSSAGIKKEMPKLMKMSFSGNEEDAMFLNDGSGHFDDVCYQSRLDFRGDGRSEAFGDLDGDGDLDLVVRELQKPKVIVARNDLPPGAHWLTVRLQGKKSNREGIGAIVRVRIGERWQTRPIRCGHGFGSQGPAEAHFGLGPAEKADEVKVEWPSGVDQRFENVPADRILRAIEDQEAPQLAPPRRFALGGPLPAPLHLARLRETRPPEGPGAAFDATAGKPTLVNVWASWCAPCKKEAPALSAHARACGESAAFVALSADGDLTSARKGAADIGLGLPVAIASSAQLAIIDRALDGMPLPATFAFDAEGKLTGSVVGVASPDALARLLPCKAAAKP